MEQSLLLFDVDATLLLTGGAGMRAMTQAGRDILGPTLSWDGIEASGGLDPLLFAEAARRSGLRQTPAEHDAFRRRYAELLGDELVRSAHTVRHLPGAHDAMEDLRSRPEVTLGLLTGNYAETAALKLRAVGIDPGWFRVAVFADEAESRPALVALAMEKYRRLRGEPIPPRRVIIIGDTPRDVDAALRNGCLALGVATGKYGTEDLLRAGAHAAVPDLTQREPLYALMNGGLERGS